MPNRRESYRFRVLCEARWQAEPRLLDGTEDEAEHGRLRDISLCGAYVEYEGAPPDAGTQVHLWFAWAEPLDDLELTGEVIRVDGRGFAVEFVLDYETKVALWQGLCLLEFS